MSATEKTPAGKVMVILREVSARLKKKTPVVKLEFSIPLSERGRVTMDSMLRKPEEGPAIDAAQVAEQLAGLPAKVKKLFVALTVDELESAKLLEEEVIARDFELYDELGDKEPSYSARNVGLDGVRIERDAKEEQKRTWFRFRVRLVGWDALEWIGAKNRRRLGQWIALRIEE